MICLIVFSYFLCSSISFSQPPAFNKHKPPTMLTHAIKTVFGMTLPSRNRGLCKGRAAWGKKIYILYYIRRAVKWVKKQLPAESPGYTARCTDHWSALPTKLSSHPQSSQDWRLSYKMAQKESCTFLLPQWEVLICANIAHLLWMSGFP